MTLLDFRDGSLSRFTPVPPDPEELVPRTYRLSADGRYLVGIESRGMTVQVHRLPD